MALARIKLFSASLSRFTEFNVLLPQDCPPMFTAGNPYYEGPVRTLFLLHGFSGDCSDWLLQGRASELSAKYNLAVVMPSGENSFFLNAGATGAKYADFLGKELPEFLQKTLNLVCTPERTLIGGLSMGGFGALHTALQFPEVFGGVVALSSALIHREVSTMKPGSGNAVANYDYYVRTFGAPEALNVSEANPEYLVKTQLEKGVKLPEIFMACGTEDFLLQENRSFSAFLKENGVSVEYRESPGIHNWDFWNRTAPEGIGYILSKL